jgi:hypothetical protein
MHGHLFEKEFTKFQRRILKMFNASLPKLFICLTNFSYGFILVNVSLLYRPTVTLGLIKLRFLL